LNIPRPKIKINKTWMMLIGAIVLSLLTTWLTLQYLKSKEQSIAEEITARSQKEKGTTIAVVVPIKRLAPGNILSEDVVAARDVPLDFTYEDTITVDQFEALKGQAVIRQVEKGKPLRRADVREVFADFSGSLKPGKRAMTINVDEINSVSHMIEPGNLVDLMLVLSNSGEGAPGQGGNPGQTVVPFLDQVKVLATGQKITHDNPGDPSEKRKISYSNFTLEVTPAQAARLALATEIGKIRAVLRNVDDKQEIDYDSVTASNLLEDIRERAKRAAMSKPRRRTASGEYVEYIIGGKGGSDATTPAINVPMPAGLSVGPSGTPSQDGTVTPQPAGAATVSPETLSQLIKLGMGQNSSKSAK
jgi:pilus assembly protein CpaB